MISDGDERTPDDSRLALALALAREGGQQARGAGRGTHVAWKGPGDRVTDVDLAVESLLVARIRATFPEDGIVSEERFRIDPGAREFVWVIDPLDGTNNYALGIPCYTVAIGILRAGQPHAGVVHDPNTGFTCWALRGHGAFAGARRLALEGRPLDAASNIALRVPLDPALTPVVRPWLSRHKFRGFGSVALHLAYAAVGGLDLVLDHKATLWDLAGGAAILLEAGGCLTDPRDRPLFPPAAAAFRGAAMPFVGGNRRAHAEAVAACRRVLDVGDGAGS